jgi:membrane-associated protease RseP (regulator of RpoE activity)
VWEGLWIGWAVWGVLIIAIGLGHPPPMDPEVKLDPLRKMTGLVSLIVFIITFTPMPFQPF